MVIGDDLRAMRTTLWVLPCDEVHVWWTALDQPAASRRSLRHTLALDEQLRADRFCFASDRERYITCRATLRGLLARYLHVTPAQVQFCYGSHGKPALAANAHGNELQFNLSHSQGFALFAIARKRAVGIDIEHIRPIKDAERIVGRFFSLRERALFRSLPIVQQIETFFNWWTRKEAFIKAIGDGLAYPLDQIDVSRALDEPIRLCDDQGSWHMPACWFLRQPVSLAGYAAALVVEGDKWKVITRECPIGELHTGASVH
jgi:4'-phosphopantetheinyl transferase